MKLVSKIILKGRIEALTGLHIGGNKSSLEIGGVDLNVIKTGSGTPYIPGSSLKGKLSSLLAKVRGSMQKKNDPDIMKKLFGNEGGREHNVVTRLQVRDALLDKGHFDSSFGPKASRQLDFDYSEIKTENSINRSNGMSDNLRQVERVPSGAVFKMEIVLDVYDDDDEQEFLKLLAEAFELLQIDYLGGHGSRGSGQVRIFDLIIVGKNISEEGISSKEDKSWEDIFKSFMTVTNEAGV